MCDYDFDPETTRQSIIDLEEGRYQTLDEFIQELIRDYK